MLSILKQLLNLPSGKKKRVMKEKNGPTALNDFDINKAITELKSKQNRIDHGQA